MVEGFKGIGFKAEPKKIGNSYYIRVPIAYVHNEIIPLGKSTLFEVHKRGKKEDD